MKELFQEIWATARRNKLRTALTGFAVAWGIFMLIVLLGAGNGLINAQMEQVNRFLSNSMMAGGGWTSKPHQGMKEGRRITLRDRDLAATSTDFQPIDQTGAVVSKGSCTISLGQEYLTSNVVGTFPNHFTIDKYEMLHGRFINEIDLSERRKVIVLGNNQARELTRNVAGLVGRYVKMDGFAFRVVGIYKERENGSASAYTAFTTLKTIYGMGDEVGNIEFTFHGLATEAQNEQFETAYRQRLNANHNAAPDDESAVWIWNRYTQSMQMSTGIGILKTALWIIGLFTLLSGIVGVSNIMLITVKERTHEFGIRKAIGARPWHILKLIIAESVIITTLFGYVGMLLGIAANEYMDATIGHTVVDAGLFKAAMFSNPTVGIDVCIEATLVMVIAGTVAGLVPALKASRVRPIEALQG